MREKDSEFINCRALIFVAVAFFCTIVGVAKTTNGGVSGKVLYANDSLYVEVSNNSNDTVYVFDTYLKKGNFIRNYPEQSGASSIKEKTGVIMVQSKLPTNIMFNCNPTSLT